VTNRSWLDLIPLAGLLPAVAGGCGPVGALPGTCSTDANVACGSGLVGYSCSGADRPDELVDTTKVVDSILCNPTDPVNGRSAYCCTGIKTTCVSDARTMCTDGASGYSCMGTNRPDAFDPNLVCGQGIHAYGLISYCCGISAPVGDGGVEPDAVAAGACVRNTSVPCLNANLGFTCTRPGLPTETDLGMNQSRSEVPLICSLSIPDAATPSASDYCCYTPSAAPPNYTCLQDQLLGGQVQTVPGCTPGKSFAFACTGQEDTPEQDYPRMSCPDPPVPGINQQGIPAALYCCSYSLTPP
jgi:hypothetical protein